MPECDGRRLSGVRICIVSDIDVATVALGSSEYCAQVARMLGDAGAAVELLLLGVHRPGVVRVPVGTLDRYRRDYAAIVVRGAWRIGGHLYSTDWRRWRERLARAFRKRGAATRGWLSPPDPRALAWAARRLRAHPADLLIANYFNVVGLFDRLDPSPPTALLMHDVVALRAASFAEAGRETDFDMAIVEEEARALARPDLCIAIKEAEAAFVRARAPHTRAVTVSMTIEAVAPATSVPPAPVALFIGGAFAANVEALRWLLDEVWPHVRASLPEARLRVLGKVAGEPGLNWPDGAERVGFVDDVAAEYRTARVALAPLLFGSGVKIKVVEALGHGVPVVATPCGAEGVEHAPSAVLSVADGAEAFAAAVIEALAREDQAEVRAAVRRFAGDHFARGPVGARLVDEVAALLDEKAALPRTR
ncbi:MAG: glycosyltransferase [Sphingomonas sp.]|uniref:glycosyltransferase n=1 Tax=Sphingomonas sp. TaxID=28214 RepID=UPI001ACFCE2A|nr:glycosyltransferase [Sphingomonas sp.]MBN8848691.1 glycosyltransferase [Sphingomonas sp.]